MSKDDSFKSGLKEYTNPKYNVFGVKKAVNILNINSAVHDTAFGSGSTSRDKYNYTSFAKVLNDSKEKDRDKKELLFTFLSYCESNNSLLIEARRIYLEEKKAAEKAGKPPKYKDHYQVLVDNKMLDDLPKYIEARKHNELFSFNGKYTVSKDLKSVDNAYGTYSDNYFVLERYAEEHFGGLGISEKALVFNNDKLGTLEKSEATVTKISLANFGVGMLFAAVSVIFLILEICANTVKSMKNYGTIIAFAILLGASLLLTALFFILSNKKVIEKVYPETFLQGDKVVSEFSQLSPEQLKKYEKLYDNSVQKGLRDSRTFEEEEDMNGPGVKKFGDLDLSLANLSDTYNKYDDNGKSYVFGTANINELYNNLLYIKHSCPTAANEKYFNEKEENKRTDENSRKQLNEIGLLFKHPKKGYIGYETTLDASSTRRYSGSVDRVDKYILKQVSLGYVPPNILKQYVKFESTASNSNSLQEESAYMADKYGCALVIYVSAHTRMLRKFYVPRAQLESFQKELYFHTKQYLSAHKNGKINHSAQQISKESKTKYGNTFSTNPKETENSLKHLVPSKRTKYLQDIDQEMKKVDENMISMNDNILDVTRSVYHTFNIDFGTDQNLSDADKKTRRESIIQNIDDIKHQYDQMLVDRLYVQDIVKKHCLYSNVSKKMDNMIIQYNDFYTKVFVPLQELITNIYCNEKSIKKIDESFELIGEAAKSKGKVKSSIVNKYPNAHQNEIDTKKLPEIYVDMLDRFSLPIKQSKSKNISDIVQNMLRQQVKNYVLKMYLLNLAVTDIKAKGSDSNYEKFFHDKVFMKRVFTNFATVEDLPQEWKDDVKHLSDYIDKELQENDYSKGMYKPEDVVCSTSIACSKDNITKSYDYNRLKNFGYMSNKKGLFLELDTGYYDQEILEGKSVHSMMTKKLEFSQESLYDRVFDAASLDIKNELDADPSTTKKPSEETSNLSGSFLDTDAKGIDQQTDQIAL